MAADRMRGKKSPQDMIGEEPIIDSDRAEEKIYEEAKQTRSIVSGVRKKIDREK